MAAKRFSIVLALGLSSILLWLSAAATAAPDSMLRAPNQVVSSTTAVLTTTNLNPSKDNTLYQTSDGSLSNGAGQYFFVGSTGPRTNAIRRGVIQFPITDNLPAGSIVISAVLQLNMSQTIAGDQAVWLHRLTADWGEGTSVASGNEGAGAPATPGDATWLHRFYSSTFWTAAGGDFIVTPSATTIVGGAGFYAWSSPDMAADIQGWLNAPATNHGWILIGNESAATTAKRFNTRENLAPETRPVLIITSFVPSSHIYLPLVFH